MRHSKRVNLTTIRKYRKGESKIYQIKEQRGVTKLAFHFTKIFLERIHKIRKKLT